MGGRPPGRCTGCAILPCGLHCPGGTESCHLQQPEASVWCPVSRIFWYTAGTGFRQQISRCRHRVYLHSPYLGEWNELPSPHPRRCPWRWSWSQKPLERQRGRFLSPHPGRFASFPWQVSCGAEAPLGRRKAWIPRQRGVLQKPLCVQGTAGLLL